MDPPEANSASLEAPGRRAAADSAWERVYKENGEGWGTCFAYGFGGGAKALVT